MPSPEERKSGKDKRGKSEVGSRSTRRFSRRPSQAIGAYPTEDDGRVEHDVDTVKLLEELTAIKGTITFIDKVLTKVHANLKIQISFGMAERNPEAQEEPTITTMGIFALLQKPQHIETVQFEATDDLLVKVLPVMRVEFVKRYNELLCAITA